MTYHRIKTIRSYTALGRFLDECQETQVEIPRITAIPSPYRYSPVHGVYSYRGKPVIIAETRHRHYEVFEIDGLDRVSVP